MYDEPDQDEPNRAQVLITIVLAVWTVLFAAGCVVATFVAIWTPDHAVQGRWTGTAVACGCLAVLALVGAVAAADS